jgi:hypothetical protein
MKTLKAVMWILVVGSIGVGVGAAMAARTKASALVWRYANDEPVNVVSVDMFLDDFHLLDSNGQIWSYSYQLDVVKPVYSSLSDPVYTNSALPTTLFFETVDCSGPAYIAPIPSHTTIAAPSDPSRVYVIPDAVQFRTVVARTSTQGLDCESVGDATMRVIRFDTLPRARPHGPMSVPPFHPESVVLER